MKRRIANSFDFDPAKPLFIPYGRYPHKKSGIVQVVDRRTLDGVHRRIANEKAAGAPGLPIYHGHPDVPELASRFPDKAAHGWIVAADPDPALTGFACSVEWVDPPAPGAFVYFSPYFFGDDVSNSMTVIDDMQSVGLTNRPNSTRFRLPNEAGDEEHPNPNNERTAMKKLLMLLSLPETATEDEAAAALQALIDEKTALTRKVEEGAAEVAVANTAKDEAVKGLANEREARIGLLLDCGIRDGKVTPATKPVWGERLRRDFANESEALAKECAGIKTRSALPNEAGDHTPAGILAQYEGMPAGKDKDAFLRVHARAINDARVSLNR